MADVLYDIFATLEDVKCLAPVGVNYTGYDEKIESLLPSVTQQIKTWCRREFDKKQRVQHFPLQASYSWQNPQTLWLNEKPIDLTAPFEVRISYAPNDWSVDPLDPDDYVVNAEDGNVQLRIDTYQHARAAQVTYTAGYPVDTEFGNDTFRLVLVDPDVVAACVLQTVFLTTRIAHQSIAQTASNEARRQAAPIARAALWGLVPEAQSKLFRFRRSLTGTT